MSRQEKSFRGKRHSNISFGTTKLERLDATGAEAVTLVLNWSTGRIVFK
ncbi:MAG: hypothetical protein ACKESB_02115 [Candidatus Hodgkinia cicadicola]